MEDKFSERFDFYGSREHRRRLKALADANSGGKTSTMLRLLIDRAYSAPVKCGLNPPKKEGTSETI